MKTHLIKLVLIVTLSLILPAQAGDLEDGIAAIKAGEYDTGRELLMPLAEQGNTRAQNAIGKLYQEGLGVEQNYVEALRWYRKAVDAGEPRAQVSLGLMYADGEGVPQDNQEAARLFRLAAEQGNDWAQGLLGVAHYNGHGVRQDYQEAAKWYRKSAEQNNAISQYNLGEMYFSGTGVSQDYIQAYAWVTLAINNGNEDPRKMRVMMAARMSSTQIRQAKELSNKLAKKIKLEASKQQ